MADFRYKVLGQAAPAAATPTTLYTVPAATEAVGASLVICNRGISALIRVAVRVGGAATEAKHYQVYDLPLPGNDSLFLKVGLSLAATDIVEVYASTATVSFTLHGTERAVA